ncbi:MAG TPA: hypothetical protein VGH67_15830 [Solirubrobacteraceae bacterium]|jgi:hypothetical protein
MQRIARPRRYVSRVQLYAMLPVLRYSYERGAYVLRFVGEDRGPVLRKDRRRGRLAYSGPERRETTSRPVIDPVVTSRPSGGVRVLGPTQGAAKRSSAATRTRSDATPRARRHGRQRPPRPRH